jgi:5-methylcytosine-specific restriction enzyme A
VVLAQGMPIQLAIKVPKKPSVKRSPKWPALHKKWITAHSTCAACGKNVKLAVHHKKPLHLFPELELDETNLITLCENVHSTYCHYTVGHCGISWMKYDPNVDNDAAIILAMKQNAAGSSATWTRGALNHTAPSARTASALRKGSESTNLFFTNN